MMVIDLHYPKRTMPPNATRQRQRDSLLRLLMAEISVLSGDLLSLSSRSCGLRSYPRAALPPTTCSC